MTRADAVFAGACCISLKITLSEFLIYRLTRVGKCIRSAYQFLGVLKSTMCTAASSIFSSRLPRIQCAEFNYAWAFSLAWCYSTALLLLVIFHLDRWQLRFWDTASTSLAKHHHPQNLNSGFRLTQSGGISFHLNYKSSTFQSSRSWRRDACCCCSGREDFLNADISEPKSFCSDVSACDSDVSASDFAG